MMTASFAAPMRLSRRWAWENTWLVYATLALVLIPTALLMWSLPHPIAFYASLPPRLLLLPVLFGFGWGIAQVTFGLSIERTGMAMAFAIVIGLSSLLGSIIPLAVFHPEDLLGRVGIALFASAVLLGVGLVLFAQAGRERELLSASGSTAKRAFRVGILLCVFTGCFGSMINMGFVFGGNIAQKATAIGLSPEKATLAVWSVVLAAGFLPNLAFTLYLLSRKRTWDRFVQSPVRETLLALAAAVLWLFGMLGYGVGATVMGKFGNSLGFAVCMATLLLWSSALGQMAGEWRAALPSTLRRMRIGLGFIILSVVILGFSGLFRS
ncbi:MAG TPA: L-rhamnose/proton symporter RhaT [Acidobacteriaceae bacterium]|nr:L-rhamnose/proton symporter RhaT [Acidobacteriaceae bacterium]